MSSQQQMNCVFDLMDQLKFSINGKFIIDIGCFDGSHSLRYSKEGALKVLGIDAKKMNITTCKSTHNSPNLEFVILDCRSLSNDSVGTFDWIHAFGILYHLDTPTELLKRIYTIMKEDSYALIDTHVATEGVQWPGAEKFLENNALVTKIFDSISFTGKIFCEFSNGIPQNEKDRQRRSAYDNMTSFWFTKTSLEKAFTHYGFVYQRVFTNVDLDFWHDDKTKIIDGVARPYSRVAYLLRRASNKV